MCHTPFSKPDPSARQIILYAVIIFGVCLALMLGLLAYLTDHSVAAITKEFTDILYEPSENMCLMAPLFKNIHPFKIIYTIAFLLLLIINFLAKCVRHAVIPWDRISHRLTTVCLILFLLTLAGIQQWARLEHLAQEWKHIQNPNSKLNTIIQFSRHAKNLVPVHCQSDVASDHDLSVDPYMLFHRAFSYYLYPEISIRFDTGEPQTCRLIIQTTHFAEHVPPEDYSLILKHTTGFCGLAVKKGWLRP